MCIPEKIHNLIIKTQTYGNVDNRNIEKIQEIDKYIRDIEYKYTEDILKMNDHLKFNKE